MRRELDWPKKPRPASAGRGEQRDLRPTKRVGHGGDEDPNLERDWSGVVCHADAECPDRSGAPLQPPLFQSIDVEPYETPQMVLNYSVEQADDLAGRSGAWGDPRLRDEDRLAREAPDQREPLGELVGKGRWYPSIPIQST
jgi:hypothetical protein